MTTTKERRFAEELLKCAGKYVATHNDTVIACGSSIREVKEKAAEQNIKRPVIFPLPKVTEGHNFF
ncbi:MAG TPA: DUF5678 domain-containing protein [Anaerolineae bacterium]|jgi:hypothetical protein|nr:DUF5678 domain-containing protein [Anaerolineae bacterium]